MALSRSNVIAAAIVALALLGLQGPAVAQQNFITVASTTSTEQSGLFKHLLPVFEKKTGTQVRVVALGTGQALDMARRGDADVVFVHDKVAEEKFVADGFGVRRFDVMYNDFVLVVKHPYVTNHFSAFLAAFSAGTSCSAGGVAAATNFESLS